jgi:chitinase
LAFANTKSDGSIVVDSTNFPTALIKSWKSTGKKVILSVGGQNGNWNTVFASEISISNFIKTITSALTQYNLDGVDLDIEAYIATPRTVANTIIRLKSSISPKLLIVSPECVTVYEGTPVPSPDVGGQAWNYFVPIINLADHSIDFYQPQAYNNWYGGLPGGSVAYLKEVYLNWRNLPSSIPWTNPIPNFAGVNGSKLLLGVLASSSAGGAAYFAPVTVIQEVRGWLKANNYSLKGFMVWDSNWDKKNNFQVSDACTEAI